MSSDQVQGTFGVPEASPRTFERNLIRQAVCELRFPTLFSLNAQKPPAAFGSALRKEFPDYQPANEVNFSQNSFEQSFSHTFKAKKGFWTVTLRPSAITLETSTYSSFENFKEKLALIIKAADGVIDSQFFTRVGLRYINTLPYKIESIADWVNPALVAPLAQGIYGDPVEHSGRVTRVNPDGTGYTFAHGVGTNQQSGSKEYVLDLDFFQEDVPLDSALDVIDELHSREYNMFMWSLAPCAIEHMGKSKEKPGKKS